MKLLILGAGPGVSRSIASLFGKKGVSATLVSRNEEKLKVECRELAAAGTSADFIVADPGNESSLEKVLTDMIERNDIPDLIVYNAFSRIRKGIMEETWANLRSQLDVNVGGAFNLLKTMLPALERQGKGKLFFTGGGYALYPGPDSIGVSIGKAALRNLVLAAAKKVEGSNVHVATVTICGIIDGKDPKYAADKIAEKYWELFTQPQGKFESEIVY